MEISVSSPCALVAAAACGVAVGYVLALHRKESSTCALTEVEPGDRSRSKVFASGQLEAQPSAYTPLTVKASPRICIVTGGSRGIGAAVCERLAADGYRVVVNYQSDKRSADALVCRIVAAGGSAIASQADVGQQADVARMFDQADMAFGAAVTCCVNNAGILGPLTGLCDPATFDQLKQIMSTNLHGPFLVMREAAKRMSVVKGGKGGAIVNVSAGSAFTGTPLAYAMSKGALNSLTAGCIQELVEHGIRVNTVSPGPTNSDMMMSFSASDVAQMSAAIPMKRPGETTEVAAAIAWLLSDDASYVVGTNLRVAGGKSLEA